jgi:NADH:ubiquinone oxidoreductase subunit C
MSVSLKNIASFSFPIHDTVRFMKLQKKHQDDFIKYIENHEFKNQFKITKIDWMMEGTRIKIVYFTSKIPNSFREYLKSFHEKIEITTELSFNQDIIFLPFIYPGNFIVKSIDIYILCCIIILVILSFLLYLLK